MKKYLIVCLILIIVLLLNFNIVYAAGKITNWADYSYSDSGTIANKAKPIIATVQIIASAVSVGTLAIIGIRIITESPNGRAEIKQHMIPYLIGAVMAFAIVPILGIVNNIFK